MRVTFLTHYYPPEVGAPQARISALARGLAARGASVSVHTCFPHYPDGVIRPPYRNSLYREEVDGPVRLVRSAVYPAANRGFLARVAGHTSSAVSALVTAPLADDADLVVAESPPLFTGAAGVPYARLKKAQLVVNVADRWPASAVDLGVLRRRGLIGAAHRLERTCYRGAARIIAVSDAMAMALESVGEARGKVRVIPPAVDLATFHPASRRPGPVLHVVYAGTLGLAHGLEVVLEAAQRAGPDTVRVTIAGDGACADSLRDEILRRRIDNVRMVGSVPHRSVPELYAGADAAVVCLLDRAVFGEAVPTKMLEAMASGRAVVVAARGEAARLAAETEAGIVVEPEKPDALADAFRRLARDPARLDELGRAGRRAAAARFSRDRFVDQWWTVLQELIEAVPPRPRAGAARRRAD